MRQTCDPRRQWGATLVELVIALVLLAIVATMAMLFLKVPLQGFTDVSRRVRLSEKTDAALRRISRDLRGALPNSVRVTVAGGVIYLEYLELRTGGRYRQQPSGAATACPAGGLGAGFNDTLEVGVNDSCFTTLGSTPNLATVVPASDQLVVYNLGPGFAGADAYAPVAPGSNRVGLTAVAAGAGAAPEDRISFANHQFTLDSPNARFHIISGPVTYECNPGTGQLLRHSGYAIAAAQPTAFAGGSLLSNGVTACTITYDADPFAQRNGVVSIWLTLSEGGPWNTTSATTEWVRLFTQVHINNVP